MVPHEIRRCICCGLLHHNNGTGFCNACHEANCSGKPGDECKVEMQGDWGGVLF